MNNALAIGAGGGSLSFHANSYFEPTALTGTDALTLGLDDGITLTPTTFQGFGGTVNVVDNNYANGSTLRFTSAFDNASLGNAALNLGPGVTVTRNIGTNGTITTDIGTLSSAAPSATLGGSTIGSGTFVYSVGGRNEDSTFAGAIVDGGTQTALTKIGTGTLALTGANTYSGSTTITLGTLEVDGSLANTPVTVANGATLTGKGAINNAAPNAVAVNGNIAAGTAAATGNLTTGSQAWNAGGSYTWRLNTNNAAANASPAGGTTDPGGAGANWDMLSMSSLTLPSSGTFTVNLTAFSGSGNTAFSSSSSYAWTIADVSTGQGNYANFMANLMLNAAPLAATTHTNTSDFSLSFMPDGGSGQDLVVSYAPAPEPTSLAMLGVAASGLMLRRRRAVDTPTR